MSHTKRCINLKFFITETIHVYCINININFRSTLDYLASEIMV